MLIFISQNSWHMCWFLYAKIPDICVNFHKPKYLTHVLIFISQIEAKVKTAARMAANLSQEPGSIDPLDMVSIKLGDSESINLKMSTYYLTIHQEIEWTSDCPSFHLSTCLDRHQCGTQWHTTCNRCNIVWSSPNTRRITHYVGLLYPVRAWVLCNALLIVKTKVL